MEHPSIFLPVMCPKCGEKSLSAFPILVVKTAVTHWNHIALYASCHGESWDASPDEVDALRAFVGKDWLLAQTA